MAISPHPCPAWRGRSHRGDDREAASAAARMAERSSRGAPFPRSHRPDPRHQQVRCRHGVDEPGQHHGWLPFIMLIITTISRQQAQIRRDDLDDEHADEARRSASVAGAACGGSGVRPDVVGAVNRSLDRPPSLQTPPGFALLQRLAHRFRRGRVLRGAGGGTAFHRPQADRSRRAQAACRTRNRGSERGALLLREPRERALPAARRSHTPVPAGALSLTRARAENRGLGGAGESRVMNAASAAASVDASSARRASAVRMKSSAASSRRIPTAPPDRWPRAPAPARDRSGVKSTIKAGYLLTGAGRASRSARRNRCRAMHRAPSRARSEMGACAML